LVHFFKKKCIRRIFFAKTLEVDRNRDASQTKPKVLFLAEKKERKWAQIKSKPRQKKKIVNK